jgi:hypothetical protein
MKNFLRFITAVIFLAACDRSKQTEKNIEAILKKDSSVVKMQSGYSEVNGIKMYYEIYGEGEPLVLIHGGWFHH